MEWNEVKAKPKRQSKPKRNDDDDYYGGQSGGHLKAGPVNTYGGSSKTPAQKHASVVADADYLRDDDEEIKFETVSHECAVSVQNARLAKNMTQA